jgi:hypothetical protein
VSAPENGRNPALPAIDLPPLLGYSRSRARMSRLPGNARFPHWGARSPQEESSESSASAKLERLAVSRCRLDRTGGESSRL